MFEDPESSDKEEMEEASFWPYWWWNPFNVELGCLIPIITVLALVCAACGIIS